MKIMYPYLEFVYHEYNDSMTVRFRIDTDERVVRAAEQISLSTDRDIFDVVDEINWLKEQVNQGE